MFDGLLNRFIKTNIPRDLIFTQPLTNNKIVVRCLESLKVTSTFQKRNITSC